MYTEFYEIFLVIKSSDDVEILIQPYLNDFSCDVAQWYTDNICYWRIVVHEDVVGLLLYNFKRIGFDNVAGLTNEFRHLTSPKFIMRLFELKSAMGDRFESAIKVENEDELFVSIKPIKYAAGHSYIKVNDSLLDWIFQIGVDEWASIVNNFFNELDNTDDSALEKSVYKVFYEKTSKK